jgi:hypothetical protein
MLRTLKSNPPFGASRDDTARASCGNETKGIFLPLTRSAIWSKKVRALNTLEQDATGFLD